MPQGRIINKILAKKEITYNDFLLQFGKVSHVRTESKNYDYYVNKYKSIVIESGKVLKTTDLFNNEFGLPSPTWFVKYCPDKSVKTYNSFVNCVWFKKIIQLMIKNIFQMN